MEEDESLARLQGLQADLVAFSESRLPTLQRLWTELEESLDDFRKLLDRQKRNDKSRKDLAGDKITIGDSDYEINEEFRQLAIQVADSLDLDEIEAVKLCILCQEHAVELDRTPAFAAMLQYHEHREVLLTALRISVQQAGNLEIEDESRDIFVRLVQFVLQGSETAPTSSSTYIRKCITSLEEIEQWVQLVDERLQSNLIIGQTLGTLDVEMLEFEKASLIRQHESLSTILCLLVNQAHAGIDEYRLLLTKAAVLDTFSDLVVHYLPILISFASSLGSSHSSTNLREARSLDQTFADKSETTLWKMADFRAAATVFWLAEYSGRYAENAENASASPLQGVDVEKENGMRSERTMDALRNGAFQLLLSTCSKVNPEHWHDPAKADLVDFLLANSSTTQQAIITASDYFQTLLSEQLQVFVDALITNMPDAIRRLKFEEDEERRNMGFGHSQNQQEPTLHLERFLTIIAYAFQGFPEAAMEAFWSVPDGNMYGFLQWASKRQSTPRAAAFCGMFQAIAQNGECADAAHKFLLDEAVGGSSAKLRRGVTLSWAQVFAELGYYAGRLHDTPLALTSGADSTLTSHTAEPESVVMLECYLRLAAHMCRNSAAAREFVLSNQEFQLHETLLDLARNNIGTRFKACAFTTLASMLTNKLPETTLGMWEALDGWVYGTTQKPGAPRPVTSHNNAADAAAQRLDPIAQGFELPFAFVAFLQTLVSPVVSDNMLADTLPFSEQLGLQYRMPGINDYVDFAVGHIFRDVIRDLPDANYKWMLRCVCLDFLVTCLSTFNDDLVVFANTTNINVDSAMSTSSLSTYVRLHPFARVMEWMFNDGVVAQLFASAHESMNVVNSSTPGSPAILALCRSIQVIDMVLRLQATYFDIVRPIVKTQSAARSRQVANPAIATFEEAILTNLHIVVDLGLYCGSAHRDLTVLSLQLLQRLAISRKLVNAPSSFAGARAGGSRLLSALQQGNDVDRVTAAFTMPLTLEERELEVGDASPGIHMKKAIVELLNKSLDTCTNKPGLAHCLLGFTCGDSAVTVHPDGRFVRGASLFHAIIRLYVETVPREESRSTSWLSAICSGAGEIIRKLLRSPITSDIVLPELRDSGFKEAVAIAQKPITANSTWAGRACNDPDFLINDSSNVFRDFLAERAALYEHASLELRSAATSGSQTICQKTKAMLLGSTVLETGEEVQTPSIFDLFDFIDLDISTPFQVPTTRYMTNIDFSVCQKDDPETRMSYDLRLVNELLLLRIAELQKGGQLGDAAIAAQCREEADMILLCLQAGNSFDSIMRSQQDALKAWSQLVVILLQDGQFEPAQESAFVLQALQMVLPKVDVSLAQDSPMTLPLMKLVYALVKAQSSSDASLSGRDINVANERLLHAFKSALDCISSASDSVDLRVICYQIARHFLKTAAAKGSDHSNVARHASRMIESAGERLIDTICEDALSSSDNCRIAALLMLEANVQLFHIAKSHYMVRSMTRLNFVSVLVDGLRNIAGEFDQERSNSDLKAVLASIRTGLALLLRLSQENEGAVAILEAGIFSSVRDSQLFATDPDIGLDIDNPEALENFYRLLVSVLRIINSIILVKGPRNNQITAQGRNFLLENRQCMQSIFKAASRSDRLSAESRDGLEELVDNFTVLISATDFLGVRLSPFLPTCCC